MPLPQQLRCSQRRRCPKSRNRRAFRRPPELPLPFAARGSFPRSALDEFVDLLDDCEQLTRIPLKNYRRFIDDFVEQIEAMPEPLHFADASAPGGVVEAGPVQLNRDLDNVLNQRIASRLKSLRRPERFAKATGRWSGSQ